MYAAEVVLKLENTAFGMREFVVTDVEINLAARDFHESCHGMGYAGRGIDVERGFASAKMHAAD